MNSKERYLQALEMQPYYERGDSYRAIARRFNTNDMVVRRRMQMLGMPPRTAGGRPRKETANEPN